MKTYTRITLISLTLCTSLFMSGCAEVINATTSKPIEMKANERTMGAKLNDNEIETAAKVNIKKADPQLEHAHVSIDSFNGIVLLTGQVPSDELRNLVADTVYKLNPVREIAPQHVHGSFDYAHPVFDLAAIRAQSQVPALQGQQNTYFCGAWTGYGFHEDGLKSGLDVAARIQSAGMQNTPTP